VTMGSCFRTACKGASCCNEVLQGGPRVVMVSLSCAVDASTLHAQTRRVLNAAGREGTLLSSEFPKFGRNYL
jgi:hypothetical protein